MTEQTSPSWTLQYCSNATWQSFTAAAGDLTCAWADYGGFHIDKCPTDQPPTTHLWAWNDSGQIRLRLRLEGELLVLAKLQEANAAWNSTSANRDTLDWSPTENPVAVRCGKALPWNPSDGRVASTPNGEEILGRTIDFVEVLRPTPLLFYWIEQCTPSE